MRSRAAVLSSRVANVSILSSDYAKLRRLRKQAQRAPDSRLKLARNNTVADRIENTDIDAYLRILSLLAL